MIVVAHLRELLENATGVTQNVIAVYVDIRGFTPFCRTIESIEVAAFLKRVYIGIIDNYFPNASFHKPTGDGLLVIIPFNRESLKDAVCDTIRDCLDIIKNFRKMVENDPMINFEIPEKVGIGISRGPACCISSDGTILDYSGKVINLASRLNDFARPSGIVFDPSLGLRILPTEIQELFSSDGVYIRGVAEEKQIVVHYTKQYTIIPPLRKLPLNEPKWTAFVFQSTVKGFKESLEGGVKWASFILKEEPMDEKQISIEISFRHATVRRYCNFDTSDSHVIYECIGNKYALNIEHEYLIKELERVGATDDTKVRVEVTYPSKGNLVMKNPKQR